MSDDPDTKCRWLAQFVCSPNWMTAATRAMSQTAKIEDASLTESARGFLSKPPVRRPAAARAISLAIGTRHVPLATAWKLLALRPQDGGAGIRAVVDGAAGLVVSTDDACAGEARGRLCVWRDVADGQYGDSAEDFFATAEASWPDEPMAVPSMRPPVSLLRHGRWDYAHAELIKSTERHFARRRRPIPPTIMTPPSDRERCHQTIITFSTELLAMGHVWSGELSIAWRMLVCDPSNPESFNVILPPLTRLLDESFTSESEMELLRARLHVWWMAAKGEWTTEKVSIFRIADIDTEHLLDDDQPELDEAFARMKAAAADPAPAGPSVVVMTNSGDTKNMPPAWREMRDVALPLVVARDVLRIRNALYSEYPHARQAVDLLTRDLREGQPVRMRPSLLVGPPGSGKSRLVRRIAEMISAAAPAGSPSLYVFRHDAAGTHDGMFSGTPKGWSSAHPSTPARAVQMAMIANPIVMVDEIEKAGESTHNGNLWHAMTPFLERETSARYRDVGIDAELDLSHVNHLATANSIDRLPAPLRDRFRVIKIPNSTLAHLPALAAQVMRDLAIDDEERSHDEPLAADELEIIGKAWARERFSMRKLKRLVGATLEARDTCARRH